MPDTNQTKETPESQHEKDKALMIEQLKKTPIVQIACEKVALPRSTYYYLRKEDPEFAKAADEALAEGRLFVNDVAESQLLSMIKNGNLTSVIYWLKNNHRQYNEKLELSGKIEQRVNRELTPEEMKLIEIAIIAALPQSGKRPEDSAKNEHGTA